MSGQFRTPQGGLIDRAKPIRFQFDGRAYTGVEGDTLASALVANGVRLLGRSFKYHRPRGLMAAGVEEPNALMGVGTAGRFEPNTRATQVRLYEGLVAVSQNRWPSLRRDAGAINGVLAPMLPAGFYYKTFLGSPKRWAFYERFIRAAAGLGRPPTQADPDRYLDRSAFCDVLVVGGGPAGLSAGLAAVRSGARVILVEDDWQVGGGLMRDPATVNDGDGLDWAKRTAEEIAASPGSRVLTRTMAYGYWDHDLVTLMERRVESGAGVKDGGAAQILWRVRAERVVLAGGSFERPLPFAHNDRPGIMLSRAARSYVTRFGALPGRRAVIATTHDDAYETAFALADAGVAVEAIVDSRKEKSALALDAIRRGMRVFGSAKIVSAKGDAGGVRAVDVLAQNEVRRIGCDMVAMSGGFSPSVHLHMQAGGDLSWDAGDLAFAPNAVRQKQKSAGASAGAEGLAYGLASGWWAGIDAARRAGFSGDAGVPPRTPQSDLERSHETLDLAPAAHAKSRKVFVDFQNDVTLGDVELAHREGYRSVEHLKRYTTLGMATDQGKTSNIPGLVGLARARGETVPAVGLTTFRPPFAPVTLAGLAAGRTGAHVMPERRTPLYECHAELSPPWQPTGEWLRPRAFPKSGESIAEASLREARCVRGSVGMAEVSTLAKFDIQGRDAEAFVAQLCATRTALKPGRGRYVFMLRSDGAVFDDGMLWRISPEHFLVTSSTANGERMAAHIAYLRDVLSPALDVAVVDVQERWAGICIAGPRMREVAAAIAPETSGLAHLDMTSCQIGGRRALAFRASYSGEAALELFVEAPLAADVWRQIAGLVSEAGGAVYGLDAMDLLRIEKGHIALGAEIDGRTWPSDLDLSRMLRPGGGFVGASLMERHGMSAPDRHRLVGLIASDGSAIPEGAMLISNKASQVIGHVTSSGLSIGDGRGIALGLLKGGGARHGDTMIASSPTRGKSIPVRIGAPCVYDPEGRRLHV